MPKSARVLALEVARDEALRQVFWRVKEAAAEVRSRGLASIGQHGDICKWLRLVTEAIINKAIEIDQRTAEREFKHLRLDGKCNAPYAPEFVNELKLIVRQSLGLCLSRIQTSTDGRTACSALQSTRNDLLRLLESEAASRVDAEYSQFQADFEVDRKVILAERRKAALGNGQTQEAGPAAVAMHRTPATTEAPASLALGAEQQETPLLPVGYLSLRVDDDRRTIKRDGYTAVVNLQDSRIKWAIFKKLAENRDIPVAPEAIVAIWETNGIARKPSAGTVNDAIGELRTALKAIGLTIVVKRGVGRLLAELRPPTDKAKPRRRKKKK